MGKEEEKRKKSSDEEEDDSKGPNFEDVLDMVGGSGRWNWALFLLASYSGFCSSLQNLGYAFLAFRVPFWCNVLPINQFDPLEQEILLNYTIPWEVKDEKWQRSECLMYKRNYDNNTEFILESAEEQSAARIYLTESGQNLSSIPLPPTTYCDSWYFNTTDFSSTIITEWSLVCGQEWLASTSQAVYMLGICLGSPTFGWASDKWGRRKSVLVAVVLYAFTGFATAGAPWLWSLFLLRFLLGFATPGVYAGTFVLAVEVTAPNRRALVGVLFCLPFAAGYMILPLMAYLVRHWRWLNLLLAAPSIVLFLYFPLLPESPRWLLQKDRIPEAQQVLQTAARWNKKPLPDEKEFQQFLCAVAKNERSVLGISAGASKDTNTSSTSFVQRCKSMSFLRLVMTPVIRRRFLVVCWCWCTCGLVYYGLALSAPNLLADPFIFVLASGALEVPAYVLSPPLVARFGRRPVFSALLAFTGLSLLLLVLLTMPPEAVQALALLGKLGVGAAYALVYLYAAEVLPTEIRNLGLGAASMAGRVGSALAPYVVDVLGAHNHDAPSAVFSACAILASISALLLPETLGQKLPDTVAEVEGSDTHASSNLPKRLKLSSPSSEDEENSQL